MPPSRLLAKPCAPPTSRTEGEARVQSPPLGPAAGHTAALRGPQTHAPQFALTCGFQDTRTAYSTADMWLQAAAPLHPPTEDPLSLSTFEGNPSLPDGAALTIRTLPLSQGGSSPNVLTPTPPEPALWDPGLGTHTLPRERSSGTQVPQGGPKGDLGRGQEDKDVQDAVPGLPHRGSRPCRRPHTSRFPRRRSVRTGVPGRGWVPLAVVASRQAPPMGAWQAGAGGRWAQAPA